MKYAIIGLAALSAMASCADPYTGLWIGSVSLRTVSEVSVPLDENNVPRAPDPTRPTATGDRADVTLILHVNDAGQVSLLKDVAIVNRNLSGDRSATAAEVAAAGSDEGSLSLVTDPTLYAEYPMQKAVRTASVVFDFGDARATRVLDELVDHVVDLAKSKTEQATAGEISTAAGRNLLVEEAVSEVAGWSADVVADADVAASYAAFLDSVQSSIPAVAASPALTTGTAWTFFQVATNLYRQSSFHDTRAMDLVRAVQAAGTADALSNAWNAAAALADVDLTALRLLSGKVAGDAVVEAARYASTNAATVTVDALTSLPAVQSLIAAALASKVAAYAIDSRATDAVEDALARIVAVAHAGAAADSVPALIEQDAVAAGRAALAAGAAKWPASRSAPTSGYTAFVKSSAYAAVPETAIRAALSAALSERVQNPLSWQTTVWSVARAAAVNALQAVYSAAARTLLNELALEGQFGLGYGDPRYSVSLPADEGLGAAALTGQIFLPANHPTNPFRHRRHPDHSAGFDITRNIRIDFDAEQPEGAIPSVTRGVSTVSGLYREEVFGIHKPLGPGKDVGIRTEGRFQLNRVSAIGSLNGK
jgi:hypothetical protein